MRAYVFAFALAMWAGPAAAQNSRVAAPNIARPAAGGPTLITERSSFPRQIERGEIIVALRLPAVDLRRFADADAKEQALERMTLGGGQDVFCGATLPSAALAAQLPTGMPLPTMCFRDTDGDGAADRAFSVLGGDTRFSVALDSGRAVTPRAWQADTSIERRVEYRYVGAQSGRVTDGGRLGESAVEVNVVTSTVGETQGLGQSQSREKMLLGCLADGRCSPLPASLDPIIGLANPTVEGEIEARILALPEAVSISGEINAMVSRERARQIARIQAATAPATPVPQQAPAPTP